MLNKWGSVSLNAGALVVASFLWLAPAVMATPRFDSRIVFVLGPDIYSMNPDGSDVKQLTAVSPNVTFHPTWAPDGRSIIYSLYPQDFSTGAVWEMNADGTNQRQIFSDPKGLVPDMASFSTDGKSIVMDLCNQTAGGCAIYRMRADGTHLVPVTHFDPNPDIADVWPVFSPDGRKIAFTSFNRGGLKVAIYVTDVIGKNIHLLTPPGIQAAEARWSPDGQKLVFQAHYSNAGNDTHGFNEEIWTIEATGAELKQITNNNKGLPIYSETPHDWFPAWSPEGDQIVFERDNGPQTVFSVCVVNADGSGERILTELRPLPGRGDRGVGASVRGGAAGQKKVHRIETGGGDPSWGPEL